ncbi:hypothetical protein F5Y19DRAFT_465642 [Xylariaceae sp. FL1651]|nr:hypothetical protein F5Y19DRAFT_465642 [Xylariaceae sp. FL1651]
MHLSPGLQDEDEQTDEAKNALNDIQRMSKHYVELRNWRISFSNTLDKVQSRRTRIQDLRHNQDEADRKFMAAVRAILPTTPQLQQLYKTMQDTRLRCQEAEQHFEDIVDELQHSQEDLKLNERKFYAAIGALETNLAQDKTDRESCSDSSEDLILRGITGDRPEAVHPLYGELRVAFGELQLARELLANTQMKRDSLHSWKAQTLTEDGLDLLETYGDAGKKKALELKSLALMTEEDHAQLEEYDNLEQTARKNIETYTEKVRDLEKKCREKGVLPSSSYFQLEGFGLDPYYRDEIRLAPGPFDCNDESGTLAHPVFPLLLSNPSHLLHEFPHTALQSLRKALQLPPSMPSRTRQINEAAREENIHSLLSTAELDNKGEFINRWLLHKLHQSALEAELLWSTFRARLKILDIDRWQRDVLHFWWRDQPAVDPLPAVVMRGDKSYASTSVACGTVLGSRPVSDSGQLDGLRQWKVEDFWPCMDED